MDKVTPNELCESLGYRASPDYMFMRLLECKLDTKNGDLVTTFAYDDRIIARLNDLKPLLEREYLSILGSADFKNRFEYKRSYLDRTILSMAVSKFIRTSFSAITLDFDDMEDIKIDYDGGNNFTVNIYLAKSVLNYIKRSKKFAEFVKGLETEYFYSFQIYLNEKQSSGDDELSLDKIDEYLAKRAESERATEAVRVDKTRKIENKQYLLGKPIKERPIKIEYLRVSSDDQVIAGTVSFFARKEFMKKNWETKEEIGMHPYFNFMLSDGSGKQQCVFFPNEKALPKMEKIHNDMAICVIGIFEERNGRTGFKVSGISICDLA
jgi:hypothetical protein